MPNTVPPDLKASDFPIAITSLSVGRASVHGMEEKVQAAAEAGFNGIELFYEDLEMLARDIRGDEDIMSSLKHAAHLIRSLCDSSGLKIINLQPFRDYEGLINRKHHEEKISELKNWLILCKILRTDMIVITSVFPSPLPTATGDEDRIINDLREVADFGAEGNPPIRFAYEPISWGAHVNTWQHAWRIIQRADRQNLGLCLDTFHVAAKVWADPESINGRRQAAEDALRQDLEELVSVVSAKRLFSFQLADAAKLYPPLSPQHAWHNPDQHPLMTWSRQARLFPLENDMGAYLPVVEILHSCLLDMGYRGWISLEVFNSSLFARDHRVPLLHAQRGMRAWNKCKDALIQKMTAKSDRGNRLPGVDVEYGSLIPDHHTLTPVQLPKAATVTALSMADPSLITWKGNASFSSPTRW